MPPTFIIYRDSGVLLARGSVKQMDLVYRVVFKLNGITPNERNIGNFNRQMARTLMPGSTNLDLRTFRVDAYTFSNELRRSSGMDTTNVSAMAKSLFSKIGVDL